jgi:hypothetical protein
VSRNTPELVSSTRRIANVVLTPPVAGTVSQTTLPQRPWQVAPPAIDTNTKSPVAVRAARALDYCRRMAAGAENNEKSEGEMLHFLMLIINRSIGCLSEIRRT